MPPTPRKAQPAKAAPKPTSAFDDIKEDVPGFDSDEPLPEPPKYRPSPLKGKLEQFYATIGLMVSIRDKYCGSVIIGSASDTAEAMDKLARQSPAVKRVLERLVATSVAMEVATAHLPIVMAVMMHHGPEGLKEQLMPFAEGLSQAA